MRTFVGTPPQNTDGTITSSFQPIVFEDQSIDPDSVEGRIESLERAAQAFDSSGSINKIWTNLCEESFFLGEQHRDLTPKKFLIQNMELFARQGYKAILMEHFPQECASELSQYLEADSFSQELEDSFSTLSEYLVADRLEYFGHSADYRSTYRDLAALYNYQEIIKAALSCGLRVIPLEISQQNYKEFASGRNRMAYLNSNILAIVERELEADPSFKYIGLIGASHLSEEAGVVGVCDVLRAQSVAICDEKNQPEDFASGVKPPFESLPQIIYDSELSAKERDKISPQAELGLTVHITKDLSFDAILNLRAMTIEEKLNEKTAKIFKFEKKKFYSDEEDVFLFEGEAKEEERPISTMSIIKNPSNPFKKSKPDSPASKLSSGDLVTNQKTSP